MNLMLAKFIASRKGGELHGFVEGDDGLFATDIELTTEDYAELGFTIKIEEVADPCRASFCGMIFAESGEIIKDPHKFLSNFGWTHSFIHAGPTIMDELLRAKALSAVYETPQCPILGALARRALEGTRHVNPRFVADGFHTLPDEVAVPKFCPSLDTRQLFADEFGVSIETQLLVESWIHIGRLDLIQSVIRPNADTTDYLSKYVVIT